MQSLIEKAQQAIANSYSPYSKFPVAAAIMDEAGNIHVGVNVENVSFGLTQCAERSAIGAAISNGAKSIRAVVVYTPTDKPTPPCGVCRQVIREFTADATVLCVCDSSIKIEATIADLLPHSFTQEQHLNT
ncbi:MAG: cytidine deaminase [Pseudohongiellaceae bacterium]